MLKEFHYKAATAEGKLKQGKISARDEKGAVSKIQAQGLFPILVSSTELAAPREVPAGTAKASGADKAQSASRLQGFKLQLGRSRVKTKDLIMFAEHLSTMLQSGITVSKSLAILTDLTENKEFSRIIQEVHNQIREGNSLWQSLEKHPKAFPVVFVNMVRAGESGGVLDAVLRRLAEFLSEIQELKDYLLSSMIYPAILALTAIAAVLIMLTVVVPRFAEIFISMGVEMPLATQVMLFSGEFLLTYWWLLILTAVLCILGFKYFVSTPGGRDWWDRFKLALPMIGPILHKVELSRFSKTLGTLLQSGVSILSAMNIVQGVVVNSALKSSMNQVYHDLKQGRMLSASLEKQKVFPSLAVNMLGVGEESGNMPNMLEKVGDMYDKDLKSAIKAFTAMFEPLVILGMGLVIGVMVVSMLLAIFSLNELGV